MMNATNSSMKELIQRSVQLRDDAADCYAREKELRAQKAEVDAEIIAMLDANGLDSARVDNISVTVNKKQTPQVEDWEQFYAFINEQNAPYLLQRRITQGAIEEMNTLMGGIPGVTFFEQATLSMRKS